MDQQRLHRLTGSLQQVAYARPVRYQQGRAGGMLAYEVKNGPLSFTVAADKCMDIAECSYKGVNLSFLSKPGLAGNTGGEARRGIMGGLLFTCGCENFGPPCLDDGEEYPMHGRMRATPAEHVCSSALWENGAYTLQLSGEAREAQLFGENILLRRSIKTIYGEKRITIEDTVENQAFRAEPLMLLYHFNFGYPLLAPGAEVVLPSTSAELREPTNAPDDWRQICEPADNLPEQVYFHTLAADDNNQTFAAIVNDELGLGVRLDFDKAALPRFYEWKSMASGDYALGLEPANANVRGRLAQKEEGLPTLAPFERKTFKLAVTILEGKEELDSVRKEAAKRI